MKNGQNAKIELYDLAKDPGERNNLAVGQAELVQRAEALLKASHQPSPDWPLDGASPQRLADKSKPNKKTLR